MWVNHYYKPVPKPVTEVVPGGTRAVLETAAGESIMLDSDMLSRQPSISLANASVSTSARGIRLQPDTTVRYAVSPMGQNTLRTAENGEFFITLEDGTIVHLNYNTTLRYPEHFSSKERMVFLEGEAYFEVAKDARRRFVVETPHQAQVEVHGTKFNLEAFALDSVVVTTLLEGRVDFVSAWGNMPMKPGEKLVYHTHGNWMDKFLTDGEVESAWKDGRIVFHNTPFDEALRMLEKRYYVDFVVTNPEYEADSFTGTFTNQRLDRILEIFEISSGVRWRYVPRADKNEIKRKIEIY